MSSFPLSENDVRSLLRLLSEVAERARHEADPRHRLMEGLMGMLDATAAHWSWALGEQAWKKGEMEGRRDWGVFQDLRFAELLKASGGAPEEGREGVRGVSRRCSDGSGWSWLFYQWSCVGEGWGVVVVQREGEGFDERQRRMFHLVMAEVGWLHRFGGGVSGTRGRGGRRSGGLSPRRRRVVELVLEGHPRKRMAERLGISPHTLDGYVKDIFKYYGVHSRAELMVRLRAGEAPE